MIELAAAALLFVGGHFVASSPGPRAALVARLGERGFAGAYSVIALALLIWMISAYGRAPDIVLWQAPGWGRALTVLIMPAPALLLVCGLTQKNPTMVNAGFEKGAADPAPGILKITRHPLMWAFGLWGLAHLLANGGTSSTILFGAITVLALVGTIRIDAKRRARDPEGFARFAAATSNLPLLALIESRADLTFADIGAARVAGAIVLYVALWLVHPLITGVTIY